MGYTNKIKDKAYVLYCEGKTQEQIARKLKIKRARTVGDWIEKYGWKERRQKTVEKAAEKADNWRAREMAKAVKGHFDVARGLRTAITKKIPRLIKAKSPNTLDIERLSKALKNTTDVERQALGLSTSKTENVGEDGGPIRIEANDPRLDALFAKASDGKLRALVELLRDGAGGPDEGGRSGDSKA